MKVPQIEQIKSKIWTPPPKSLLKKHHGMRVMYECPHTAHKKNYPTTSPHFLKFLTLLMTHTHSTKLMSACVAKSMIKNWLYGCQ